MSRTATDPTLGSMWIVSHTPFHIVLYDDLARRDRTRLGHGESIIVLGLVRSFVRVLTGQGRVGFMDIGWWVYHSEPTLIEVAS